MIDVELNIRLYNLVNGKRTGTSALTAESIRTNLTLTMCGVGTYLGLTG